MLRKLFRRGARRLVQLPLFASVSMAARAHHAESLHLGSVAAGIPADFNIGHCLAGLPAAAQAAQARGVRYGFDVEDFHDAETDAAMRDPVSVATSRSLQTALLPPCRHLTAAAPLIAQQVEAHYGVRATVVLNVFPRTFSPSTPIVPGPITIDRPARLYWFSQTIGPGRGLEAVIAAVGQMQTPVELHLRGFLRAGYDTRLQALATKAGVRNPISFLAPGPSSEMVRLAAGADLGLSTEESVPLNRDICLTNKIFTYLLAGIPQLLSSTSAQRALAPALGDAALLADLSRPEKVAQMLDTFFADPTRMNHARQTAWNSGQEKYCWDVEKDKFLASVRKALVT